MQSDPDYRQNQIQAQVGWAARNPEYWCKYRLRNPDYTKRNRELQRIRNGKRIGIAKMDVSDCAPPFPSGLYRLSPIGHEAIAKMGACTVQLTVLPMT
ncbi:hypothetical protein K788_0001502 (plasmid) [Paraburkholderia caribensis MBA4]|uniref:Uncharacterized protein n=2 Tax=Paraburkholderia caribensis TaxID=75105 RepID=A0A0P0RMF1_9BURK|nr:hypothetical protein K788_0001502 [Paraburkholderia caribensis MBA4]